MRVHMMGIGGSGMSGVAKLARAAGFEVTGCDLESSTAYSKHVFQGHDPKHLEGIDLLVISPAVIYQNSDNPEYLLGKKKDIVLTWQEFLGKYLLKDKRVICVAGTHGKSTTTAMVAKLLSDAGLDPSALVGANVLEWNGGARVGDGKYFVLEADEFNDNFLNYHPEIIILNNIEFDHPDYFGSERDVIESFRRFINNLIGMRILIVNGESLGIQKLLDSSNFKDVKIIKYFPSKENLGFNLKIPGKHNIANALGVIRLAEVLGIKEETVRASLESFAGVGRRLELIADRGGIKVYDDYAHHPTAIAATLQALRSEYPKARIWAVDEPHGFARTRALLSFYQNAFKDADKVIIGPIFKARDKETFGITPGIVAKETKHDGAKGFGSFEEIKDLLAHNLRKGDVVLVMGAGKSYLWAREIANLIPIKFSDITSFRIGGRIRNYFEVRNEVETSAAIRFAKENKLPIFIIGDGTDILVSDRDFPGVVIKYVGNTIHFNGEEVVAEAGVKWDDLVKESVNNGLQGIESLSGIPGTVGAAPIQNIGAYGSELSDVFVSLRAFSIENNKLVTFNKKDCKFGYRDSIFKHEGYWQKYVIFSVTLKLSKNNFGHANYESLGKYLTSENPTISEIRSAVLKVRSEKLEDPNLIGNAGSFFKSPIVEKEKLDELRKKYPDVKFYETDGKFKLPAGWIIERAGWKGKTYKTAAVSSKHALILINPKGNTKAEDVYELSEMIIADVYKKFGIKLEREVQLINF